MALCTVQFSGESIGKKTTMNVIVPAGKRGPLPVLYLLHGLSDDHSTWQRRTSLERYAEGLRLIIAMPDGHRSCYANDPRPGGLAYEDHIVRDVVGFVDRTFHTIPRRGARAVAGLSMGGYGALMLAFRHGDVFATAASHSGAFLIGHKPVEGRMNVDHLSAALPRREYDLWSLARRHARSRRRLSPKRGGRP